MVTCGWGWIHTKNIVWHIQRGCDRQMIKAACENAVNYRAPEVLKVLFFCAHKTIIRYKVLI